MKKILHFDDESVLGNMFKLKFEKAGFIVQYYEKLPKDEEEFINLVLSENPNIILTDIIHQGLDGFEMTEILKGDDRTKNIPIIAFTNMNQEEDIKRGIDLGMSDYIVNTTKIEEIVSRINNIINNKISKKQKTMKQILDKTMELIESSKRTMAARFCSGDGRNETFGIDFGPITPEIDSNMAAEAYGSIGIYFSKNKTDRSLSEGQFCLILMMGEDIMVGSFIIAKLGGEEMINEMRKRIIDLRIKNVGDRIDGLEEAVLLKETNDYFDHCLNFGNNLAK